MGQFGEVWLATHPTSEQEPPIDGRREEERFAIKVLQRDRFKTAAHEQIVMNERDALMSLKHPFLLGLINS